MRNLEIETRVIRKSLCARIKGDVDSGNALALRKELDRVVRDGPGVIFVDLSDVKRMDSAGIAVLVEAQTRMKKDGRHFGLVNTPGPVKGLLELLGVFDMYADIETGLVETQKISAPDTYKPREAQG